MKAPAHCLLLASACLTFAIPNADAGQYFQDFSGFAVGATNFGDGSTLFSTSLGSVAGVQGPPENELALTANNVSNVTSAFLLPALDPGAPVYAFSVKWNSQVYGNFGDGEGADGFSLNFGQLSSVNLTNGTVESGYGVGLSFDVQTYQGSNPGFYVRVNGATVASQVYNPLTEWGNLNDTRHFWEVDWNYYSGMTVRLDGQTIFANVATTNFTPQAGDVFAWGARCGSFSEEVRLDNIVVVTGGNLVPVPAGSPYFSNGDLPGNPDSYAFDGNNGTYWQSLEPPPVYVGGTLAPPNAVAVYAITSAEDANDDNDPQTWTLDGSADSGGSWTISASGSGYFLNREETRCWMNNNATAFDAYRLEVSATALAGNDVAVGELRFYALSAAGAPYEGWVHTSAPKMDWQSIASSADGTKLAAAANQDAEGHAGPIYTSANSGTNWTPSGAPSNNWTSIASSADGTKLAAASFTDSEGNYGGIYISANSGTNWTPGGAPNARWTCIASSSNGTILLAGSFHDTNDNAAPIYTSIGSGTNWAPTSVPDEVWASVTASADGTRLAAAAGGTYVGAPGAIYTSTNSGTNWTPSGAPSEHWGAIASSADGTKLAAAVGVNDGSSASGLIYTSADSGSNWTPTIAPNEFWNSIASSADGTKLAAVANSAQVIYMSADSGAHWTLSTAPAQSWNSIASSADGTKLAAASSTGIYTWSANAQFTPPSPTLTVTLTGGNPAFSWPALAGGNFILQQNTNPLSTNWLNVNWPVILGGSNYVVVTPDSGGNLFYRLKSQ